MRLIDAKVGGAIGVEAALKSNAGSAGSGGNGDNLLQSTKADGKSRDGWTGLQGQRVRPLRVLSYCVYPISLMVAPEYQENVAPRSRGVP